MDQSIAAQQYSPLSPLDLVLVVFDEKDNNDDNIDMDVGDIDDSDDVFDFTEDPNYDSVAVAVLPLVVVDVIVPFSMQGMIGVFDVDVGVGVDVEAVFAVAVAILKQVTSWMVSRWLVLVLASIE